MRQPADIDGAEITPYNHKLTREDAEQSEDEKMMNGGESEVLHKITRSDFASTSNEKQHRSLDVDLDRIIRILVRQPNPADQNIDVAYAGEDFELPKRALR